MDSQVLKTAIGAISGTSMDGIDVVDRRDRRRHRRAAGAGTDLCLRPRLRAQLLGLLADPAVAETDPLAELEAEVSDAHADAILAFMRDFGIDRAEVDVVGLHGQTVFHRPERRFTRQLGDGPRMAARIGIDVINRFRHADVAAGGEGAPFAPLYHRALAASLPQPVMVLNLGGVGNVTYIDGDTVIAFDTGPASALLDDFVLKRLGRSFDEDGRLAASGTPDKALREPAPPAPLFRSVPRRSRSTGTTSTPGPRRSRRSSDAMGRRRLAAFTVESVADAVRHVPSAPKRWLVTGGGRLNGTFMRMLAARLGVPVEPVEAVGWNGDFIEAQCFGYLAVRSMRGLPLSLPTTTGVPQPMTGGEFWKAA